MSSLRSYKNSEIVAHYKIQLPTQNDIEPIFYVAQDGDILFVTKQNLHLHCSDVIWKRIIPI